MYIKDGIAYAGEEKQQLKIVGVRPMDGYKLWLRFNDGEAKIFDFSNLLEEPAFLLLKDKKVFNSVYIDFNTVAWNDGEIDIAPEYLYENSILVKNVVNA